MTVRDYLNLCWMAYIDMPPLFVSVLERGGAVPVAALADSVLRMDAAGMLKCVKLNEPAREAARQLLDSEAVVVDYINENTTGGFVAYVVRNGDETLIAMRGSESPGECVDTYVDWVDNVCERAAVAAAEGGTLLVKKTAQNGILTRPKVSKNGTFLTEKDEAFLESLMQVGVTVKHKTFGAGKIIYLNGTFAEIKFDRYPVSKTLDLRTCVMNKLITPKG